jgi:hypothetical protein
MLRSLALPVLALLFITVHVGAHPLRLAARAPTNGDVQILARAPPAATESLTGTAGNDDAQSDGFVTYAPSSALLKVGLQLYYVPDASYPEDKRQECLQKLFILLTDANHREMLKPHRDPTRYPQGLQLVQSLIHHAMEFNTAIMSDAQSYSGAVHSPQTQQPVLGVWSLVSLYRSGVTFAGRGRSLQGLLDILTATSPHSGGGDSEAERTLLSSLKAKAVAFKDALHLLYVYNCEFQRTSFDISTKDMGN